MLTRTFEICSCNKKRLFDRSRGGLEVRQPRFGRGKEEGDLTLGPPKERRQFGRRTVFKPAVIEIEDGQRINATVIDLSEAGAKLKVADPGILKGEFNLEITGDDVVVRCRCVQITNGVAGLQFVRPPRRLSWLKK
jgi:hypothetical protein